MTTIVHFPATAADFFRPGRQERRAKADQLRKNAEVWWRSVQQWRR